MIAAVPVVLESTATTLWSQFAHCPNALSFLDRLVSMPCCVRTQTLRVSVPNQCRFYRSYFAHTFPPSSPADNHTTTIFSEFSLEGKTAVISGGNGGLGLEMALAYVEAGANVYAIDIPEQPSEEFRIVSEHCRIMNRKYVPSRNSASRATHSADFPASSPLFQPQVHSMLCN